VATISFARGVPSPDLLPVDVFGEAARAAVERDGRTILNYGPPGGYLPLREWIARRHDVDPGRVVVTNGSLQGFHFVMRHLLEGGGSALVEAPSYDRTLLTLRKLGADVEALPLRDDGLDVGALAEALDRGPATVLYTIPTFQNPSGRTLSRASRKALAELVLERDLLVYEDDPYGGVRFEGEELPTLYELTGGRNVIYSSSFSKVVAPGIRVGYAVLPEELVQPIEAVATETYISPSVFVQGALHEFLTAGRYEEALERVRAGLRDRRDAMLESLERDFPEEASWSRPEGGYFLWLDLPAGVATDGLFDRAAEADVTFVKGADFFLDGSGQESARLAFSFPSPDEIREGIARLGVLVRESAAVAA
jgi:2-aminoadipate transaminase